MCLNLFWRLFILLFEMEQGRSFTDVIAQFGLKGCLVFAGCWVINDMDFVCVCACVERCAQTLAIIFVLNFFEKGIKVSLPLPFLHL